eukprot:g3101.t1
MASLNTPPAKRQRTTLQPATIEALKEKHAEPINIGILVLPAGIESTCGILTNILEYLDIRTLCNVKRSSLIQQFRKAYGSDDFERVRDAALQMVYDRRSINEMIQTHSARRLYLLIERYKREFPRAMIFRDAIPTPIICACDEGRMDDVELFMNLHPFHKDEMTLKDMMSQVGTNRYGGDRSPLMAAAKYEHFQLVKYLIEQGEADPNIANSDGENALHYAACFSRTNTELIELLLNHMTIDSINKMAPDDGNTPLDDCYDANDSPIRQEIIALLRSKGGIANKYDENGNEIEIRR